MSSSNVKRRAAAAAFATRLDELMNQAGVSLITLARVTGLSYASICSLHNGKTEPGFTIPIVLADFFGVPLDYLCGRCDEETAKAILTDYPRNFMKLRRAAYEDYLLSRRTDIPAGYESPWPYNLIEDIRVTLPDRIIRPDQEAGLMKVIDTLSNRNKEFILAHYRDGRTFASLGEEHGISQERVRQIVAHAVRIMNHPSRRAVIEDGYDQTLQQEQKIIEERRRRLAEESAELMDALAELDKKRLSVDMLHEKLDALQTWDEERRKIPSDGYPAPKDIPIEAMDLSTRAMNVLLRADINTLGDVISAYKEDRLLLLRNMGRKTYEEIVDHAKGLLR